MTKREFFRKYLNIDDGKILDEMEHHSEVWTVKKREIIMQEGETVTDIPFLISGVLKAYYHDSHGVEKVYCFAYRSGDHAASIKDIYGDVKAICTVEAVQESELCYISLPVLQKLIQKESAIRMTYETLLTASIAGMVEHEKVIASGSPSERYAWFREKYHEIESEISRKDIASYLNMTPEHLSRITRNEKES